MNLAVFPRYMRFFVSANSRDRENQTTNSERGIREHQNKKDILKKDILKKDILKKDIFQPIFFSLCELKIFIFVNEY